MKMLVANCRGISSRHVRNQFFKEIKKMGADVVVLSETKLLDDDEHAVRLAWGQYLDKKHVYMSCQNNNPGRSAGVAVLLRQGLNFTVHQHIISAVGRHVVMDVTIQATRYILAAFYGDASANDTNSRQTLQAIYNDILLLKEGRDRPIVFCGDFNFVQHIQDSTRAPFKTTTRELMDIIEEDLQITDLWMHTNPDEAGHTITTNTGRVTKSRLDRIYVTPSVLHNPTMAITTVPKAKCDHRMLQAELTTAVQDKPLYKHPDYLLQDINYRKSLDNAIRELLIVHSKVAEQYYQTPPHTPGHEPTQQESHHQLKTDLLSELEPIYVDRSDAYIAAKINNLLSARTHGPVDNTKSVTQLMESILEEQEEEEDNNPIFIWEALLDKIRTHAVQFRKRRNTTLRKNLNKQIEKLSKLAEEGKTPQNDEEAAVITQEVEVLSNKLYIHTSKQSAIKCGTEGDRPTRFYLSTGRTTAGKVKIHQIIHQGQELLGDDATQHMMDKFQKLLGEPSSFDHDKTVEEFLQDSAEHVRLVPDYLKPMLEKDIVQRELDDVVAQCHADSSPGYNGFSYQLLKTIWPLVRRLFLRVIKKITETPSTSSLPLFMRIRKLILLAKPGKDPKDDNSYRPISLLDISYKILASVLANRLKSVAGCIIGEHQKGYMEGRCAADITRSVQDIRDYALHSKRALGIVGLDFAKAFDSVSHVGLLKILSYLGFPEKFTQLIALMIRQAQIILEVNGKRSVQFTLQDGTGQGDPLSSYLFNAVVEMFIIKLSNDNRVKLFQIGQHPAKPEAFADDIHMFIDGNDPDSLNGILEIAAEFKALTGLTLSPSKTEVLEMNKDGPLSRRARNLQLLVVDRIKFVGAYVTRSYDDEERNLNYANPINKINTVVRSWNWRRPTPAGAAIIVKSLLTSTMTHLLSNIEPTQEVINQYNKLVTSLIWNHRSQVQKKRIHQPIGAGGMNIPDINKFAISLKIRWYRKLLPEGSTMTVPTWRRVLDKWLEPLGIKSEHIPRMGYNDLAMAGSTLCEHGHLFWGNFLTELGEIMKIWENNTKQLDLLPIFGGRLQATGKTTKWMSIFNNTTPCKEIFLQGITQPNKVFQEKGQLRYDPALVRDFAQLGIPNQLKGVHKNITRALQRILPQQITTGQIVQGNYPLAQAGTLLHVQCLQKKKGAQFIYKALLQARAEKQKIEVAPAYYTWRNTLGHDMTTKEWYKALEGVGKHRFSPRARWASIQIFLRTLWTPLKQYRSYGEETEGYCPSCNDWPADTQHLLYRCITAERAWEMVADILTLYQEKQFKINEQMILFHAGVKNTIISGTIMAAKAAILAIHRQVTSRQVHERVIAAFLRTQLILLADTYIRQRKEEWNWMALRGHSHRYLQEKIRS